MNLFKKFITLSGINQLGWLNPLSLAIFPAVLIIWIQPLNFDPLNFELFDLYPNDVRTIWFDDLENDGNKEKIILGKEETGGTYIMYFNEEGDVVNQYNFRYLVANPRNREKSLSVDINKDGIKEILIFTQNMDSLFLNIFDYKNEESIIENRFITVIGGYNDKLDFRLNHLGVHDTNHDSVPEIYFSVAGGFSMYPRRIFRYDVANNSVINSINTGAGDLHGNLLHQGDSILVVVSGIAHGNIREWYPYPYHDTTSWILFFDQDLKLQFSPKSYGENPCSISVPIQIDNNLYAVFNNNKVTYSNEKSRVLKMNWQGEVIDSLFLDFAVDPKIWNTKIKDKNYYYFRRLDKFEFLSINTSNFKIDVFNKLHTKHYISIMVEDDINDDGKIDYVVDNIIKKEIHVYNESFRNPVVVTKEPNFVRFITSNYYSKHGYGELAVVDHEDTKIYRYFENPNWYYKYPLWIAIYLMSVLFVGLILYFQNRRTQEQQKTEQQLADLQLQNLRNQLDPHFTFNVLNSIGNAIYKQDKEAAYDMFQRFTRIIRSSLMVSDRVFRTLKEELQFTQDYLEFQKIRFKERFNYKIEIGENIEAQNIKFPKMLIQGFGENAVKHAFYGIDYTGLIKVMVKKEYNLLRVIIDDNGIGINRSKKIRTTTGTQKGEKLLEEQVRQINRMHKTNYSILIKDKTELDISEFGTKVTISVTLK